MQSLTQSSRRRAAAGHPLPDLSPSLSERGIRIRRGQVTMLAAPGNGGKSFFALHYVVTANLPTLYISADTDSATTLYRSLAMLTQDRVDDIEEAFEEGADDAYRGDLVKIDNVRFTFDPTPTLDDINLEVLAFEEMWGDPPHIIVIDNLLNVVGEGQSSWSDMMETSQFLHHLARKSEAAVLILHHTSEAEGKAHLPAPRKAIINKVSQLPEVILTLAMEPTRGLFHVACVKNRSGTHDATGGTFVTLYVEPERMQIFESQQEAAMARQRWEYA